MSKDDFLAAFLAMFLLTFGWCLGLAVANEGEVYVYQQDEEQDLSLRLGLVGDYYKATLYVDDSGQFSTADLYVNYRGFVAGKFNAGQGLEHATDGSKLQFLDRSLVAELTQLRRTGIGYVGSVRGLDIGAAVYEDDVYALRVHGDLGRGVRVGAHYSHMDDGSDVSAINRYGADLSLSTGLVQGSGEVVNHGGQWAGYSQVSVQVRQLTPMVRVGWLENDRHRVTAGVAYQLTNDVVLQAQVSRDSLGETMTIGGVAARFDLM